MIDGFDEFPEELRGATRVRVECDDSTDYEPDACGNWQETIGVHPPDVMMDNRGYLHFNGPPTECPECRNSVALRYNDVLVVTEQ